MLFDPVMVGTGGGTTETASDAIGPLPQALTPQTVTFPGLVPKVTVMVSVLIPAVMIAPGGVVHV
jgi:hypothetical protein